MCCTHIQSQTWQCLVTPTHQEQRWKSPELASWANRLRVQWEILFNKLGDSECSRRHQIPASIPTCSYAYTCIFTVLYTYYIFGKGFSLLAILKLALPLNKLVTEGASEYMHTVPLHLASCCWGLCNCTVPQTKAVYDCILVSAHISICNNSVKTVMHCNYCMFVTFI